METGRRMSAGIWDWPLQNSDGLILVHNDHDRFEADLQVPPFRANEIDVKVMNDELIVNCFQESVSHTPLEVHRTYAMPPDVDPETLTTTMKNDDILQIVASKKKR